MEEAWGRWWQMDDDRRDRDRGRVEACLRVSLQVEDDTVAAVVPWVLLVVRADLVDLAAVVVDGCQQGRWVCSWVAELDAVAVVAEDILVAVVASEAWTV